MRVQLTARLIPPGGAFFRRGVLVRLGDTQIGIVCEACDYRVTTGARFDGWESAEQLRLNHLKTAHLSELIGGGVTLFRDDVETVRS